MQEGYFAHQDNIVSFLRLENLINLFYNDLKFGLCNCALIVL